MKKLFIILFIILSQTLNGQENNFDFREIEIRTGWFLPVFASNIQANSIEFGLGTFLNLEQGLKLPGNKSVFTFEGEWNINKFSGIGFGMLFLHRSGFSEINGRIQYGNIDLDVGTTTDSWFNLDFYKFYYMYSLVNAMNFKSSLSIGLSLKKLSTGIIATLQQEKVTEQYTKWLPVPIIGFFNGHKLYEKLYLRYSGNFFAIKTPKYLGTMLDFSAGIEYNFNQNSAIGLGYKAFSLDVEFKGNKDFNGKVEYSHHGINIYLTAGF